MVCFKFMRRESGQQWLVRRGYQESVWGSAKGHGCGRCGSETGGSERFKRKQGAAVLGELDRCTKKSCNGLRFAAPIEKSDAFQFWSTSVEQRLSRKAQLLRFGSGHVPVQI